MKRKCSEKKEKTRLCLTAVLAAAMVLFSISVIHAAGFEKYPGDVNVDRQIDVSDGVLLARFCVEDITVVISDEGLANADADGDQHIDGSDTICVLRMIAGQIPMPENPYEAKTKPETDSPVTTEPPAETDPPETVTEAATSGQQEQTFAVLTADQKDYPLDVSVSVLSLAAQPDETLTVQYQYGNVVFAVYAAEPEKTMIAFAHNDDIFGYYILCREYTAPDGYLVQEMRDQHDQDRLYAVLVQKDGLSVAYPYLENKEDFQFLSKLAYYATNGVRAVNGLDGYLWDEELAKAALSHSREMADNDFCDHNSLDGTKFSDRLLNFGIDWQACAENIDFGYLDPFSAVNGWYNSKSGHRNNLLSSKYERIGIGFAYNADSVYSYYGTQDFYCGWG
ncbi:MAG: hypothetical protein J5722_08710 [Oscillospiraceae bacterium]|nr:hypothetical protein [Oscillospiraceae bacterium]